MWAGSGKKKNRGICGCFLLAVVEKRCPLKKHW